VKSGSSYLSQSELPLTFGLGRPSDGKTVTVGIVWPRGGHETISGVKPNQEITLKEGGGMVSAKPIVFSPPSAASAH
jgi:enediyne biosynthesis protein E4